MTPERLPDAPSAGPSGGATSVGSSPPARPPGRHSHVAGRYERDGLVVFGGAGLRGPLADVWLFEAGARRWRCLSAALGEGEGPEPREMAAGCMISDAGLLVHGGRGAEGELLSDLCIFDGRAGRWVLAQETGVPRCAHAAVNAAAEGAAAAAALAPAPPQPAAAEADAEGAAAAGEAGGGQPAGDGGGAGPGGSAPAVPANVLLYGGVSGFSGEAVAGDLLQLTFLRQPRGAGAQGWVRGVRVGDAAGPAGLFYSLRHAPPPCLLVCCVQEAAQAAAGCERSCGQWRLRQRARRRRGLRTRLRCCRGRARRKRCSWAASTRVKIWLMPGCGQCEGL